MTTRTYTASTKQAAFIEQLMVQRQVPVDLLVVLANERNEGFPGARGRIDQLLELPYKPRPASEKAAEGFVGDIGDKVNNLSGEIKTYKTIHSDFGTSLLIVIRLDDGHIVKFFGSGQTLWGRDKGERATIELATVKGHETYQDDDQTVLTRVKFAPAEEEGHFEIEARWIDSQPEQDVRRNLWHDDVRAEVGDDDFQTWKRDAEDQVHEDFGTGGAGNTLHTMTTAQERQADDEDILGHWGLT